MFINKTATGSCNLCGASIKRLRIALGLSQRQLADLLQLHGLTIDKNAVQRMECGKRFITDIELLHLSAVLAVPLDDLFKE